ncbi:hypothetical protein LCGC14_1429530 [marine sediment metagenome]|uniref:Uncharacterized protein n=1 Tax=marine sediment metagenome TaxID=412755 RepID=A0A0F9M4H3_9ZZZZ
MTLLDIRTNFITDSGRNDLVIDLTDYADRGANRFINAGQRFLDGLIDTPQSQAKYEETLDVGATTLTLEDCRAIEEVYLTNAEGGIHYLTKVSLSDIREAFPELSSEVKGVPTYYAINVIRVMATELTETIKGIIFMSPADDTYDMVVEGKFFTKKLVENDDINYWTENHEDVLGMAALYKLETFYRNREGARDWLQGIMEAIRGIDHDIIAEEIAGVNQIKG